MKLIKQKITFLDFSECIIVYNLCHRLAPIKESYKIKSDGVIVIGRREFILINSNTLKMIYDVAEFTCSNFTNSIKLIKTK